jgi:cytosine/creatinine deaminase
MPPSRTEGDDVSTAASAHEQLTIRGARLLDGEVVSIDIRDGRYVAIRPHGQDDVGTADPSAVVDADGGLVTESFVNAHLHLDKVHTLDRVGDTALEAYTGASMGAALSSIDLASAAKADYTPEQAKPHIRRALEAAVANGVLHVQAFVDVDEAAGLSGLEAVRAVREEFAGRVDVRIVAFPQDGLVKDAAARELCETALREGADVVGGIPWIEFTDADALEHVQWACALAQRTGKRVAMLVDDAGDTSLRTTGMLAQAMIEHDLVGRGVACHARAVGQYPLPTLERLIGLARRAGLGFVTDPHTGPLHLPVRQLLHAGLPVALGQDDIEDAYYPFGRHNMLEVAFLAAHLLGFLSRGDQRRLIDMVTGQAAAVLGIPGHAIAVGNLANLCVHGPTRVVDLLSEHAAPRWVIREGAVIARTETTTELLQPAR